MNEVQDDTHSGNGADIGSVTIRAGNLFDGTISAVIHPIAFSRPNLAVARQLIAMGQLIEELALNPSARRQS